MWNDFMDIKIQNIVATASVQGTFDLDKISMMVEEANFKPGRFPGLIYKLKEPKTTLLLFTSGKMVCTGAKNIETAKKAVHVVLAEVGKLGINVKNEPEVKIQNIVATTDLESELNLASIALTFGLERVEYEPEQFPGLVYRVGEPKVVFLLFRSGKVVCVGAKEIKEIEISLDIVSKELQKAGLL